MDYDNPDIVIYWVGYSTAAERTINQQGFSSRCSPNSVARSWFIMAHPFKFNPLASGHLMPKILTWPPMQLGQEWIEWIGRDPGHARCQHQQKYNFKLCSILMYIEYLSQSQNKSTKMYNLFSPLIESNLPMVYPAPLWTNRLLKSMEAASASITEEVSDLRATGLALQNSVDFRWFSQSSSDSTQISSTSWDHSTFTREIYPFLLKNDIIRYDMYG